MLKKILAIVLYFLALTGFAVLFVVLSLKFIFPEHKLKQLFSDGIRGYTGRDSDFKSIKWGLNGIDIEGMSISAKPDFKKGTFLTVKKINYKPAFLPGKEAGLLTVDSPAALVEYFPGSFDIRLSSAAGQVIGGADNRAHYLPFFALKVFNGEAAFLNKNTGRKDIIINKLELGLKKGSGHGMFEGGFSAEVLSGGQDLVINAEGSLDYNTVAVNLSKAKIEAGPAGSIIVSGVINNISSAENTEYVLNIKGDRRALDKVFELLPGGLANLQYSDKDKVDMDVTAGEGNLKVKDNLYVR
jgi:hypothetical protein